MSPIQAYLIGLGTGLTMWGTYHFAWSQAVRHCQRLIRAVSGPNVLDLAYAEVAEKDLEKSNVLEVEHDLPSRPS